MNNAYFYIGAGRVIYLKDSYRNRILNLDNTSNPTSIGTNESQKTISSETTDGISTSTGPNTSSEQDPTSASSSTTSFDRIELFRSQFSKQKGFKAKTRTANHIRRNNNNTNVNNDTAICTSATINMNDASEVWVERIYRNKHTGQNTIYFVSSTTGKRVAHYPPPNAAQVLNLTDSFRRLHVRHIPTKNNHNDEQRIESNKTTSASTPIKKDSEVVEHPHEEYESILSTSITEENDASDSEDGLRNSSSVMNSSLSLRSSSKRKGLNSTSPVKRMPLRVIGGEVWTER